MAEKVKRISFVGSTSSDLVLDEQPSSDEESFYEITTSEAESFCSSDEEDAERLNFIIEGAFSGSPAKLSYTEPALRDSLLLLDKDLVYSGEVPEGKSSFGNSQLASR